MEKEIRIPFLGGGEFPFFGGGLVVGGWAIYVRFRVAYMYIYIYETVICFFVE